MDPNLILQDFFTSKPITNFGLDDIAVVGSSGNLLRKNLGKQIDAHSTVIRMNCAPVGRYSRHVGSKTTIRVVAHNAVNVKLVGVLRGCEYLMIWGVSEHYTKIFGDISRIRKRFPALKIYKLTSAAMAWNDQEFTRQTGRPRLGSGTWLSTGWFSLFLAISLGKKITACGFGCAQRSARGTPYHYWEPKKKGEVEYIEGQQRAKRGHRFITEMDIFVEWSSRYSLRFL